MFADFFRFELRFWLRGMMVYVFLGVMTTIVLLGASSDNVRIGSTLENALRNAPFNVQSLYATSAIMTCLMITAFVNGAASRDFTYNTYPIIFTKPIRSGGYLWGRFLGATLISVIPMLGVSLGFLLARWMPWTDKELWGPVFWGAHAWSVVLFAIPNTIIVAAIIFTIAVLTRSNAAAFIGAILLIIGYGVSQSMLGDLDNEWLAVMLDPFGERAFNLETKYWTVHERNTEYVRFTGQLLANRIAWLTIAIGIFAIGCWRFQFGTRSRGSRRIAEEIVQTETTVPTPTVAAKHDGASQWSAFASQFRLDMIGILKSPAFLILMLTGFANTIAALYLSRSEGFGLGALPVTYNVIDTIRGALYLFLIIVIAFYSGVLVWKERDAQLDEVYDSLPHKTWTIFTAKLAAMLAVVVCILIAGIVSGILVQASQGYTRFQLPLYLKEFLVLDLTELSCLVILAFVAQVVSPHKYFGYFFFIILVIANQFVWRTMDVETRMVRFGSLPGYTYSDLYEFAPFAPSLLWFGLYWVLFAAAVCLGLILFWQRGRETHVAQRFRQATHRVTPTVQLLGFLFLASWGGVGSWVYYNTQVRNEIVTSDEDNERRANYEKELAAHAAWPQPRVTAIKYTIDIFPERRALHLEGRQTIENQTDAPLTKFSFVANDEYETAVQVDGASLQERFDEFNYEVWTFEPALAPGESRSMTYTVDYEPRGFENSVSNTSIVQNGTFFNNTICPQIGYQPGFELTSKRERKKYDLGPPERMPPLAPDDLEARRNTYISNHSDWVHVETTISTSAEQRAIAPGSLQDTWEENGRRYFRYELDHPSLNFYSFISADFAAQTQTWKGIDIEVYYHPDHHWNVDKMLRSIRKSLEYYSENFGPYRHKQARIIEFPRIASFAQAFPGTMPYSEGIGFIASIEDEDDIDMVYYVVAHEMAHQWWAHQVIGANMQGATLLSETLAQYSALMVMEREYGRDMMRKFLKYEMDRYLSARGSEALAEQPLVRVESSQGYVHYRKGSVVMYYLREMIGEDRVNAALQELVQKFGYRDAPYPTSTDLIAALEKQVPEDLQYLLEDLFQKITLFSNRTLAATYQKLDDGRFEISLDIECEKFQANEKGEESSVAVNDWIEVGAFAKPEEGQRYGKTLHRERIKIQEPKTTVSFCRRRNPG